MASTPTARNRFNLQGTGDNSGTWGSTLNDQGLSLIDTACDGFVSVAVAANVTLSSTNYVDDEARNRILKLTGAGGFNVVVPGVEKWYLVHNACTAAVVIKTSGGTGATINPAMITPVYCDGTDCAQATNMWPFSDGTAAAPGAYFSNDTDSGFYRIGANNIGLTLGGTKRVDFAATGTVITGTLDTSGAGAIGGTLNVGGNCGLAAGVSVGGGLVVAGAVSAGTTLGVTGATTLTGSVNTGGALTVGSSLGVTTSASVGTTFGVTGATTLTGAVNTGGTLTVGSSLGVTTSASVGTTLGVTGATTLGSLTVNGTSALTGAVNTGGTLTTGTSLAVTTSATVGTTLGVTGVATLASGTATPAGGSVAARHLFGTTAGFGIYYGSGAPTVTAAKGSLYLRSDGTSTTTRMYVNNDGATGWSALVTAD